MNSRPIQPVRPLLLAALFLLASAVAARADVQDGGGFFSQDAIQQADQTLNKLRRDTGKELLIETVATAPAGVNRDNLSQSFEQLTNQKAKQAHVNGVYVMICKDPGIIAAAAGNSTAKEAFSAADVNRLRQTMQAAFKRKDFDGGLQQGVAFVDRTVRSNEGAAGTAAGTAAGGSVGGGKIQQFPSQPSGAAASPRGSTGPQAGDTVPGPPIRDTPASGGSGFGTIFWIIVGVVVIGAIYFGLKLFTGRSTGQASAGRTPPVGGFGAPGQGGTGGSLGGGMGGGMGGGLLGGLLGGAAGNLLGGVFGNRSSSGNSSNNTPAQPPTGLDGGTSPTNSPGRSSAGGGTFDESSDVDASFGSATSSGTFGSDASDPSDAGGVADAGDAGGGESFDGGENTSSGKF